MDSIQQNIVDSYNKNAMERDSYSFQDWKVKEREIFLETLKTNKCRNLLEIGAGPGRTVFILKNKV